MILRGGPARVLIATEPVDLRRGLNSLPDVVQEQQKLDLFSGAIFVFRAKRTDRVKILAERNDSTAFRALSAVESSRHGQLSEPASR